MDNHQSEFAELSAYSTARWNTKFTEVQCRSGLSSLGKTAYKSFASFAYNLIYFKLCVIKKELVDAVTYTFLTTVDSR